MPAARSSTIDTTGRSDLKAVLLTGVPGLNFTGPTDADLLRLNTAIKPARSGACPGGTASPSAAGSACSRTRTATSAGTRTAAGSATTSSTSSSARSRRATADLAAANLGLPDKSPNDLVGDGVDANDVPFSSTFPYVASPHQGYEVPVSGSTRFARRWRGPASRRAPPPRLKERACAGKRLIFGAAAAGMTAVALLLGGVLHDSSSSASPVAATARLAPQSTAEVVAKAQAEVRANPYDVTALDKLGLAYQQSARETGDPTYYTKSGEALRRALKLAPRDLIATSGLGSLALSRHRFRDALELGRRAQAISPTTARNYGVIGDALVELGRYRDGFRAFDAMASTKPDVSSYSRIGHARYLIGDVPGAIDALQLAADAAEGQGETAGVDARPAQQGLLLRRPRSPTQQREARRRAARVPGLRARVRLARVGAVRAGRRRRGDRVRARGRRPDPAAAVRRDAR